MMVPMSKRNRNLNAIVGNNIRRLRQEQGLSQEDFADLTELHRTYIGGVERGERNITLDTLLKISNALQVPPTQLLLESDADV